MTNSFSDEMEVQRKREPPGLKFKCDWGMEWVGVHLLRAFIRKLISCKKLLSVEQYLYVYVGERGRRISIHRAWFEPVGKEEPVKGPTDALA